MGKVNGSSGIVVVDDLAEQETPLLTQISRCAYSNIIAVITAAFIVALWNSHASGSSPNGAVTPKQDRYLLHDSRITDNTKHKIKSKTGSNNSVLNGHKKSLKFYTKNSKLYSSTGNSQNAQEKDTLADKPPEKSVLFERGRGGYNNYRIPSLIVTKKGTLLAFCEGREAGDAADIVHKVKELNFRANSYEVWAYDTETAEWLILEPLPYSVCSHRVAKWKDQVYIVGHETRYPTRGNTYARSLKDT